MTVFWVDEHEYKFLRSVTVKKCNLPFMYAFLILYLII